MKGKDLSLKKQVLFQSIQVVITLAIAMISAFYINLITNQYPLGKGQHLSDVIKTLGLYNFLPFALVILIFVQVVLSTRPYRTMGKIQRFLVNKILENACKSLIHPHETRHIRAIVTLVDFSDKTNPKRKTAYTYHAEADPERYGVYPVGFGITGEAFQMKSVIVKELPKEHYDLYDENTKKNVLPQIKTVMAAPIYSDNHKLIGILAFDTTLPLSTVKFDTNLARSIAQSWADILGFIITKTGYNHAYIN